MSPEQYQRQGPRIADMVGRMRVAADYGILVDEDGGSAPNIERHLWRNRCPKGFRRVGSAPRPYGAPGK